MRTDRKTPKRAILKHSEKKPSHTIDWGFDCQFTMFEALWDANRNLDNTVTCPYTGEKLYKSSRYYISYFAHILPKKNYPYFKLNPENVSIVSNEFHRIIDQGTRAEREAHPDWKWDEWDTKVIQMKAEYVKFKKDNLLA